VSRDYKHRAQKKPAKKPLPGWLWLLTGLLLGGFIVGLVWLKGQSDGPGGGWVGATPDRPPQRSPDPPKQVVVPAPPKPRFDFYSSLSKDEVVVPEHEIANEPDTVMQGGTATPASYLVQVGSFRRTADADRLKAQLALLGFEATVVSARVSAQDTWHRVRSGPYIGKRALQQARQRLAANGFKGLVIRVAGN